MRFLGDWQFWVSIITAFAAITALYQTSLTLRLNNKQYLYSQRVSFYHKFYCLFSSFSDTFSITESYLVVSDLYFYDLTNNVYLESIQCSVHDCKNAEYQKLFLTKMSELFCLSKECKFLFYNFNCDIISEYIELYSKLLDGLRRCVVAKYSYDEMVNEQSLHSSQKDREKILKDTAERYKLFETINRMHELKDKIKKLQIVNTLEKSIRF